MPDLRRREFITLLGGAADEVIEYKCGLPCRRERQDRMLTP
jgi:hypothetical protein